jgi:hypothetical protein
MPPMNKNRLDASANKDRLMKDSRRMGTGFDPISPILGIR